MTGLLRMDVVDRVARLTIDRPEKRNALSTTMLESLLAHVTTIAGTPDITAVVVRGTGGSFSAGGDLAELGTPGADGYRALAERAVSELMALAPPKVAQIDGACLGAGCSLALACDVRVCSPAARFGIPALKNGLTYEPVFVRRLVQVVGPGPAGLLLYGGERWTAQEAATRGLVDRLDDDVSTAVEHIVTSLRAADRTAVLSTAAAIRSQ
jgi:enoyl-CoA hydratase/carnithine racemase